MSANTATSRDTPATRKHTPTHMAAQRAGAGRGEGSWGPPILSFAGQIGGQGECIEHIMYTRLRRGKCASTHRHMGWTRAVCFVRGGGREKWGGEAANPGQAWTTHGAHVVIGVGRVGSTHSSENMQKTLAPRQHSRTHTDTAPNKQTHPMMHRTCGNWGITHSRGSSSTTEAEMGS